MPETANSADEAQLYRYIIINHRSRQFLWVVTMSKIDALLFDERQLKNKSSTRCYLESDAIKHFPSTAPLEFKPFEPFEETGVLPPDRLNKE